MIYYNYVLKSKVKTMMLNVNNIINSDKYIKMKKIL